MTNSRNRLLAGWFLGAGLILAGTAAAQAQSPPPPPVYPVPQATGTPRALPGMEAQQPAPAQTGSDDTASPATAPDGQTAIAPQPGILGQPGPAGIVVSTLGEVEGPPTGTLDSTDGGLGPDLWDGSRRGDVEDLMSRLPIATPIAALRALARRIVLTKAAAPTGAADQALMTVRIRRLLDAGLLSDAANLAAIAQVKNDPGFARAQADAILFAGQKAHLCDDTTATRLDNSEPFWIELRAYCYAVGGDDDALALTRSVMDAQSINDDAFDTLLDDIENNVSKDPGGIDNPTALHLFLLRQARLPVDYDIGAQLGTPGLLLAFRSPQNSPEDRLKAAEGVLRSGALSPQELTAIADAQSFTADQFMTEHTQLQALPFLAGEALLRQAARRAPPGLQPALIYEALYHGQTKGLFGVAAVLQQDALAKLQPQTAMHDMADLMGRALMLVGKADDAARWMTILDPKRDADKDLIARFQVALNLVAPNPDRQMQAQQGLAELSDVLAGKEQGQAFAALALGLYSALDLPLSPEAQKQAAAASSVKWPGRRPAPSTLARLDRAVAAPGRKGEALMLVLNAIGARGLGDLAPDVTVHLVRILMKEGVAGSARDIAIAALLRYRPAPSPVPGPATKSAEAP